MNKLSESILIANLKHVAKAGNFVSVVDGQEYYWDYRTELDADGYIMSHNQNTVTSRKRAEFLVVQGVNHKYPLDATDAQVAQIEAEEKAYDDMMKEEYLAWRKGSY